MFNPKKLVETLLKYDAWNIDKTIAKRAEKAAKDLNTSEEEMRKKSAAVAGIYGWLDAVLAIAGFSPEETREIPEVEKKVLD